MEEVSLSALLAGISTSVQEAQQAIEKNAMQDFFSYFEESKAEGQDYEPYVKKIMVPAQNSVLKKNTQITVPVPTMIHHKKMLLDEVVITVHGKLEVKNDDSKVIIRQEAQDVSGQDEIRLVYRSSECTEGTDKIIQSLLRSIE